MSKQDRQGVRTPSDLERKYDFGNFMKRNRNTSLQIELQIKQLNQNLTQLNTELLGRIDDLRSETSKYNQTWFFSGKPTLENAPAAEWSTDDIKTEHVGDIYFDTDDGRIYLFKATEDTYEWASCYTGGGDSLFSATASTYKAKSESILDVMPITATAVEVVAKPYVENVGSACINTDIIPTNHRVVAEVKYTGSAGGVYGLFGYFSTNWTTCYNLSWVDSKWYFCAGNSAEQISNAVSITDMHTIDFNNANKEALINGVKIGDTNGTVDVSVPMAIFCRFGGSTSNHSYPCRMRVYSFKIYERENNTLVRDFVPAQSTEEGHNGEACLFDNVEQKYYYSSDLEYGLDY